MRRRYPSANVARQAMMTYCGGAPRRPTVQVVNYQSVSVIGASRRCTIGRRVSEAGRVYEPCCSRTRLPARDPTSSPTTCRSTTSASPVSTLKSTVMRTS